MVNMKKENIGIVTFPIGDAGYVATSNLLDIISSFSNKVFLITGNKGSNLAKDKKNVDIYSINHKKAPYIFLRIIKYIGIQLRISFQLIKNIRNTRVWIFFIGGNLLIIPMIIAKILRKKTILVLSGSSFESFKSSNSYLTSLITIFEYINRILSNHIIVYSKNLINQWNLRKFKNKISISSRHFINFDIFNIKKSIQDRKELVGYIGRLSEEKGISVLIKALPIAIKNTKNIEFIIVGDGKLKDEIQDIIRKNNLENRVKIIGWIPHENIPDLLNELKLLVLPSYTEGLPNIILEAMACGTPVLATSVGAVPDIINDKETGFIISENNPNSIVEDIINILSDPSGLHCIVLNAKKFVEKNYTFITCVENYKRIIEDVLK